MEYLIDDSRSIEITAEASLVVAIETCQMSCPRIELLGDRIGFEACLVIDLLRYGCLVDCLEIKGSLEVDFLDLESFSLI